MIAHRMSTVRNADKICVIDKGKIIEQGKIEDLLRDIGSMLKRERLYRNLSQKVVSERSGISESALKNLESGRGASLTTFIQVCRTLGKDEWIMRLGPADAVSVPVVMFRHRLQRFQSGGVPEYRF